MAGEKRRYESSDAHCRDLHSTPINRIRFLMQVFSLQHVI